MWFEWVESNACFGPLAVFVFGDLRQSLLRSLRFSSLTPPDLRHKVLGFRLSGTPIFKPRNSGELRGFCFLKWQSLNVGDHR